MKNMKKDVIKNNGKRLAVYAFATYMALATVPTNMPQTVFAATTVTMGSLDDYAYDTVNGIEVEVYRDSNGKLIPVTTVAQNSFGWWYVKDGVKAQPTFGEEGNKHDIVKNENGWWYIDELGQVDFNKTGLYTNVNGTWYVKNGKVDFSKNGIVESNVDGKGTQKKYFVVGGAVCKAGVTGKADVIKEASTGKWYAVDENGLVKCTKNKNETIIAKNANGVWFIDDNGAVDFEYCGLIIDKEAVVSQDTEKVYYFENGKLATNFNGIYAVSYDSDLMSGFYLKNGAVTALPSSDCVVKSDFDGKWYYVDENGDVFSSYNGIAQNKYGTWVIEKGVVNFNPKDGEYKGLRDNQTYVVKNKIINKK